MNEPDEPPAFQVEEEASGVAEKSPAPPADCPVPAAATARTTGAAFAPAGKETSADSRCPVTSLRVSSGLASWQPAAPGVVRAQAGSRVRLSRPAQSPPITEAKEA
ncbi:hypothetical protein SCALM49S_06541 [Streptomyces californicus]